MGIETLPALQFIRPNDTTAYAAGELIANSTTAASVVPLRFTGGGTPIRLRRARMLSSNNTITNKNYRLFLFSASPTVTNGDNGALAVTAANAASLVAILASTAAVATGAGSINFFYPLDGAAAVTAMAPEIIIPSNTWGLLSANAAYTPTAQETFDISLEGIMDGLAS